MEIKNKNVFVTGSTRGIGKAIALQFAKAGSNLIINGRSAISEELLAEFTAYGVKAIGISGDISKCALLIHFHCMNKGCFCQYLRNKNMYFKFVYLCGMMRMR